MKSQVHMCIFEKKTFKSAKKVLSFLDFEEDWPNLIKMIATILYAHIFLQYKTRVLLSFIQLEVK